MSWNSIQRNVSWLIFLIVLTKEGVYCDNNEGAIAGPIVFLILICILYYCIRQKIRECCNRCLHPRQVVVESPTQNMANHTQIFNTPSQAAPQIIVVPTFAPQTGMMPQGAPQTGMMPQCAPQAGMMGQPPPQFGVPPPQYSESEATAPFLARDPTRPSK